MMKNKIESSDVLMCLGLVLLGIGLVLWFNLGVSLAVIGALLVFMGFFGSAMAGQKDKR